MLGVFHLHVSQGKAALGHSSVVGILRLLNAMGQALTKEGRDIEATLWFILGQEKTELNIDMLPHVISRTEQAPDASLYALDQGLIHEVQPIDISLVVPLLDTSNEVLDVLISSRAIPRIPQ